ncbi:glucose-1-phosphate cytidylyltransferase [Acidithiobacillus thiooxidans]|uniref:glucose-1-phosphate cytidylyltransferase n=1 Tax=Acidithiobacillus thiooxidans TaxID=930 RepID=UPI001C072966|nr:glucose-1-phosphate cytidylyltransferase [Acidithiobacillus thiooxidans]MBU2838614.1 glucose-1-phosphate cytidylyltransferase [Acidithiobacillus thiooxidans]MDD2801726.1 glucose-1-phosphate cytidylyltransferase [Methylococcales bacterium]
MKVLLLAGGLGTRLAEETTLKPKPMVEVGGKPILWHIMKHYSHHGFNEFVILLGHMGFQIKEYFANYFLHQSDVTIDLTSGKFEVLNNTSEPWKVTLLDTGVSSMTGGRVARCKPVVGNEPFLLTYGDGVSNVNLHELLHFHNLHGRAITMTSAQLDGRFGALNIDENSRVLQFSEKPKGDGGWVNAGFFVCEPKVFDYITNGDQTIFEQEPLRKMAHDGELYTYKHQGFWQPMDTIRDKQVLQTLWDSGAAPWKVW